MHLASSIFQTNYGWNDASVVFRNNSESKKITLTGLQSIVSDAALTKKSFGVGFAGYTYQLDNDIICIRIISAKPSVKINEGNPSFVVTLILKNNGSKEQLLTYNERMLANFVLNSTQYTEQQKRPLSV